MEVKKKTSSFQGYHQIYLLKRGLIPSQQEFIQTSKFDLQQFCSPYNFWMEYYLVKSVAGLSTSDISIQNIPIQVLLTY